MAAVRKTRYSAADIQVLEGLEPIRKRPAMYIGGVDATGYHHLLWEILDNSVDEVINGYASRIEVTLHKDGKTATIVDDGRGIPIDVMPKYKKPALEMILTTLHSGGKFEQGNYIHSGGLHGVGASVVNALSASLIVRVKRDGKHCVQTYAKGLATSKLKTEGKARGTGTTVTFTPDAEIFGLKAKFDSELIRDRLEAKSYLHRGMIVVFRDETQKPPREDTYQHDGGIAECLAKVDAQRGKNTVPAAQRSPAPGRREPLVTSEEGLPETELTAQGGEIPSVPPVAAMQIPPGALFYRQGEGDVRLEVALVWTEATDEHIRSYVNGIPTPNGGTHEAGLRSGIVKAVRNYIETHGLAPKGVTLTAEDIREGVCGILSSYVIDPQFQGQTKGRLNNPETTAQVEGVVRPALEKWLNDTKTVAEPIIARIILAAGAREASRAAAQQVTRKTAVSHRLNLPGKLADCASTNPQESQLFIVEGDSAGGSPQQGRDRRTQAILPVRGEGLNADHAKGNAKPNIMRFKGLGEMTAEELKSTTLDPKRRLALRVTIPEEAALDTERTINDLLGKDVSARFKFIMERAGEVKELDV